MKCVLAAPQFYYDGVFHNILLRISLIYRQIYSVYIIRDARVSEFPPELFCHLLLWEKMRNFRLFA